MEYPNTQENHTKSQPLGSKLLSPQKRSGGHPWPQKDKKDQSNRTIPNKRTKNPYPQPTKTRKEATNKALASPTRNQKPRPKTPTNTKQNPTTTTKNPQLPYTSSPLKCTITRFGLALIKHCPMRSHNYQESAEPYPPPGVPTRKSHPQVGGTPLATVSEAHTL